MSNVYTAFVDRRKRQILLEKYYPDMVAVIVGDEDAPKALEMARPVQMCPVHSKIPMHTDGERVFCIICEMVKV